MPKFLFYSPIGVVNFIRCVLFLIPLAFNIVYLVFMLMLKMARLNANTDTLLRRALPYLLNLLLLFLFGLMRFLHLSFLLIDYPLLF